MDWISNSYGLKGKIKRKSTNSTSLLFASSRGKLYTIKLNYWILSFVSIMALAVTVSTILVSYTIRTRRENEEIKHSLANTIAENQLSLENLNKLIANQNNLLKEANATIAYQIEGSELLDRTISNYALEYERMLVTYIDTSIQGSRVSRGQDATRSFREDVTALRELLKTAKSAALDVSSNEAELLKKTKDLNNYISSLPSFWPTVVGSKVYSGFGMRLHPVYGYFRMHEGLDIGSRTGDPIFAAASGTVTLATRRPGYGKLVEIDHGNGFVTKYAHASKIMVSKGDFIEQGEQIALIGATGTATGPHLHFEILVNGTAVDPTPFIID